ncbi:J domain-containing protein [Thermosulfurimonas marina]|uniref:J domain-containing protein n=1 Tax=Thermosulfurimonas marina TaxID=2047767 RepID=A0A6H1WQH3_9BACT|nr:J domain-containing protein [Thermosulfurimonas marina]QJA05433.1 J domain-containing protein [Thermosulfurimonas marina]
MRKNPFEVLGLSPRIVKELDEESLFRLVKACYRTLQQVYHPDLSSGSGEKALEINLAFEALNLRKNPESFRHWRRAYLRRLSRKTLQRRLEELHLQLGRNERERENLAETFWQSLLSRARQGHLLSPPPQRLRLKIYDIGLQYRLPYPVFGRRAPFKEFLFDEKGRLWIRLPGASDLRAGQSLRLLGGVPREKIEPWLLLEKTPSEGGLLPENFLQAETFKRACLPYLRHEIRPNLYLFSLRPEESSRLYLEGLLLEITPLPPDFKIVTKDLSPLQFCQESEDSSPEKDLPWVY